METGEGDWIPIPMETEEGWGPYSDRTGVSTGKCFRRVPKSRAPQGSPQPKPCLVSPFTSAAPGNGGSGSFSPPQRHHDCPHLLRASLPLPLSGGKRRYRFRLSLAFLVGLESVGAELEPPIGEREGRGTKRRKRAVSYTAAVQRPPRLSRSRSLPDLEPLY